jgi:hypothetical protein
MTKKSARRHAANLMAQQQGVPTTQTGVDVLWAGIVSNLNAAPPGRSPPAAGRVKQSQAVADAMWTSLATGLNKAVGLATPVQDRAR